MRPAIGLEADAVSGSTATRRPRVALVCLGIGRFQRGFERYFSDLFEVMQASTDITLFVSAGADGVHRRVPPGLAWLTRLAHRLPVGRVDTEYREYKQDCLAYGVALLAVLLREQFDVVHLIDPPLAKVVERLGRPLGLRSRLLFTNGSAWPPQICPRRAHLHHVQQDSYAEALALGDPPARNTLIPCGVHARRFEVAETRAQLRQRHGIADSTFVVLVVAAVKRAHKRVDHVIDEVTGLDGDVLLWIDGKPEDASVIEQAQRQLGARVRVTHVPSAQVGELYALADVLAHAALQESFGLTVVEALCSGLPVVVHDAPHFRWLTGEPQALVDMQAPGALRQRLAALQAAHRAARPDDEAAAAQARAQALRQRYDWDHLHDAHAVLYRQLAAGS